VNGRFYVYAANSMGLTKTGKLSKWFDIMDQYVDYRFFESPDKELPYSLNEIDKLRVYDDITDNIVSDIALNLSNHSDESIVCIEGYSYSSKATRSILDLVTFGTLLRTKLLKELEAMVIILSPSSLKKKTCKFSYNEKLDINGKNLQCRNNDLLAGGNFRKPDMMNALLENEKLRSDWYVNLLKNELIDIINPSKIPKPIEDLNDVKLMYEIIVDLAEKSNYDPEQIELNLLR
jgi:hypothetical protein